jgi:hypothetical protein
MPRRRDRPRRPPKRRHVEQGHEDGSAEPHDPLDRSRNIRRPKIDAPPRWKRSVLERRHGGYDVARNRLLWLPTDITGQTEKRAFLTERFRLPPEDGPVKAFRCFDIGHPGPAVSHPYRPA